MSTLDEFSTMWSQYVMGSIILDRAFSKENSPNTSEATRNWIHNSFHNTCCVRVSYALNHTIDHKITNSNARAAGLSSRDYVTGKNGKYIFNVPNMSTYLNDRYGSPTHEWENTSKISRDNFRKEIDDKQGIIIFHQPGGGINGHADLWDKGETKTANMFESADTIEFWEASN